MKSVDLDKLKIRRDSSPVTSTARAGGKGKWVAGAAVVLGLALAVKLLGGGPVNVQTTRVGTAWPSQEFAVLDATGYVVAKTRAAVASKGTGRVEWLGVREGDRVEAGTVVARLESTDVEAAYRASRSNAEVAKAAIDSAQTEFNDANDNLQKSAVLFEKGLIAQTALRDAKSRVERAKVGLASARASYNAAQANQDNAKSALDNTEIRAPFSGVVISRSANVGDIVTPLSSAADAKGAVVVMADMNTLEIAADVSESALSRIQVGQSCEIALDAYPAKRYKGVVASIVPTVNRASATVTANIKFLELDGGILPDMSARVSFLSQPLEGAGNEPVIAVSPKALIKQGDKTQVLVVEGGKLKALEVTPGRLLGDLQAVTGNIQPGQVVVLNPTSSLKDGQAVGTVE